MLTPDRDRSMHINQRFFPAPHLREGRDQEAEARDNERVGGGRSPPDGDLQRHVKRYDQHGLRSTQLNCGCCFAAHHRHRFHFEILIRFIAHIHDDLLVMPPVNAQGMSPA